MYSFDSNTRYPLAITTIDKLLFYASLLRTWSNSLRFCWHYCLTYFPSKYKWYIMRHSLVITVAFRWIALKIVYRSLIDQLFEWIFKNPWNFDNCVIFASKADLIDNRKKEMNTKVWYSAIWQRIGCLFFFRRFTRLRSRPYNFHCSAVSKRDTVSLGAVFLLTLRLGSKTF